MIMTPFPSVAVDFFRDLACYLMIILPMEQMEQVNTLYYFEFSLSVIHALFACQELHAYMCKVT